MKRLGLVLLSSALASLILASPAMAAGTKLTARGSDFGTMIWAPKQQAAYMFAKDGAGKSRCYGACARAWPPVLTKDSPRAGRGVDAGLLGTTRRREGAKQVTYDGKPLYTYAHEGPDQVLCHDIFLNGGWWYVIGPDGERRP